MEGVSKFKSKPHGDISTLDDKLIKTLGYRNAIQACLKNQWLGVLPQLQKSMRHR